MVEVREVLRGWLEGAGLRKIAERSGVDRKTARRYVAAAEAAGLCREAGVEAPARLVRRFGTEAALVLSNAVEVSGLDEAELLAPGPLGVTLAELIFGITHEGAADVDDLLDRRTRVGLIPQDRALALPMAERAFKLATRQEI